MGLAASYQLSAVALWSRLPAEGARDHASVCKLERNGWAEPSKEAEDSVLAPWDRRGGQPQDLITCVLFSWGDRSKGSHSGRAECNPLLPLPRSSTTLTPSCLLFIGAWDAVQCPWASSVTHCQRQPEPPCFDISLNCLLSLGAPFPTQGKTQAAEAKRQAPLDFPTLGH